MTAISTYANAILDKAGKFLGIIRHRGVWMPAASALAGFLLSAASLGDRAMPLSLGLLCAAPPGVYALAVALGGCLGYLLFWGEQQGVAWMAAGLLAVAVAGDRPIAQRQKLLFPALAALAVSSCGLLFLLVCRDNTPVSIYLLRVVLSGTSAAVYRAFRENRTGVAGWLCCGLCTLALAQIAPIRFLGLGYLAAGLLGVRCSFPAVALTGLGLDLAQITAIPMTGVLCLSFCLRLLPRQPRWLSWAGPTIVFGALSVVLRTFDPLPLPGLVIGSILGQYLPGNTLSGGVLRRKGAVGFAQVRLEKAALTLEKMEHTLLLPVETEPDHRALLRQAADCSCDACPERRGCKARHLIPGLPAELLEQPGLQTADLPPGCRKPARLLGELRRGQEQLRRIKGEKSRLRSYRAALGDQYALLSAYLRDLSDNLSSTDFLAKPRYRPEIGISSRSLEERCGDRCDYFEAGSHMGYLLLCDGMGTGEGAAVESQAACSLLKTSLQAGFSPQSALRSFNSLCALRYAGGSATVDLLEMDLRSGRASLYKWGAAPSYQLRGGHLQKIGTAGPPPGLSQQSRETVDRLSLGGGEVLIMLSDGAGAECLARQWTAPDMTPGEMASWILEQSAPREDDATVAVVRLHPLGLCTH